MRRGGSVILKQRIFRIKVMIKKFIFIIILMIFTTSAYAAPLIPGGIVTSPFAEGNHFGHTHAGIDVALGSGTPILAPSGGYVTHGSGNGYIYWVQIDTAEGITYFVGDCREDTLDCPTGYVLEGTVIGISGGDAYNGPLGFSTGPHAHIEVFDGTGYAVGAQIDPAPYLAAIGVDLTGNLFPSGDGNTGIGGASMGSDNVELPWGVESMYEIGSNVNKDIEYYSEAASQAFKTLQPIMLGVLTALAIIDLTLPLLISGFAFSQPVLLRKVLKYGFVFFVFFNWQTMVNELFLGMVSAVSGSYTGDLATIEQNISQPQLLIQKCVFMLTPALNKIASYKSYDFFMNLQYILPIFILAWVTIIVYIMLALRIALIYVDLYLTAAMNVVTLPFAQQGFLKFIPEGTLGHLFAVTIELLVTSIMVWMAVMVVQDASPGNLFALTDAAGHVNYLDGEVVTKFTHLCIALLSLAFLTGTVPTKIAGLLGGKFEIG